MKTVLKKEWVAKILFHWVGIRRRAITVLSIELGEAAAEAEGLIDAWLDENLPRFLADPDELLDAISGGKLLGSVVDEDAEVPDGVEVVRVPCEVYSRIVGYLRPTQNWNDGKKQEFEERVPFRVPIPSSPPINTLQLRTALKLHGYVDVPRTRMQIIKYLEAKNLDSAEVILEMMQFMERNLRTGAKAHRLEESLKTERTERTSD